MGFCREGVIVATNLISFGPVRICTLLACALMRLRQALQLSIRFAGRQLGKVKQNPCQDKHAGRLYLLARLGERPEQSLGPGARCRHAGRCPKFLGRYGR